jgi:predicted transcriptional regulator
MKLKQIAKILNAEVISNNNKDLDLKMGCGSDLMSDVLIYVKPDSILLTGLTNIQVIYTASTAGIKAICFVRGKKPPEETVDLAKKKNIALLTTGFPMFESCGRLYNKGLIGCSEVSGVPEQ